MLLHSSQRCFHFACLGIVRYMADKDFRRTTGMFATAARLGRLAALLAPITGACRSSFRSPAQLVMKSGHFGVLQPVEGSLRLTRRVIQGMQSQRQAVHITLMLYEHFRVNSKKLP